MKISSFPPLKDWIDHGTPYDWSSLLHYSGFYDSANGQATIIDNANGQPFQANEFLPSSMDIYQICMAYGCNRCAGLDIDYYDGQGTDS